MPSSPRWRASTALVLVVSVIGGCGGEPRRDPAAGALAPQGRLPCSRAFGDVTTAPDRPLASRAGQTTTCCSTENRTARRHYEDGFAAQNRGDSAASARHYRAAITLDAEFCEAMVNLGLALKDEGKLDEAIEWYQRARRLSRNNTTAIMNLALAFKKAGRASEAKALYQELLTFDDESTQAEGHFGLAQTMASADFGAALDHAREAYGLYRKLSSPLARDGALLLGVLLTHTSCTKALPYLREARSQSTELSGADVFLGACLAALGRDAEAEPYLRRAQERGTPLPTVAAE